MIAYGDLLHTPVPFYAGSGQSGTIWLCTADGSRRMLGLKATFAH